VVGFILEELRGLLVQSGLYLVVRAIQYSIPLRPFHFFTMLERYNSDSCTFFTPRGEKGFALHEMYEVSGLWTGDLLYEKYIPRTKELHLMKKDARWFARLIGR